MDEKQRRVESLSGHECWNLLGTQSVGRVVTSAGGALDIFPVNYRADGSTILFRTAPGDKLLEMTIHDNVIFEVDDLRGTLIWSVVAKGAARALQKQAEIDEADSVPLHSWMPTAKDVYVRITPHTLTGRRFERAPESDDSD